MLYDLFHFSKGDNSDLYVLVGANSVLLTSTQRRFKHQETYARVASLWNWEKNIDVAKENNISCYFPNTATFYAHIINLSTLSIICKIKKKNNNTNSELCKYDVFPLTLIQEYSHSQLYVFTNFFQFIVLQTYSSFKCAGIDQLGIILSRGGKQAKLS